MSIGGAGVDLLPESKDEVTGEDIVDKLLFVICILKERDDSRLEKLKGKGYMGKRC